jgi:hypothetical protein
MGSDGQIMKLAYWWALPSKNEAGNTCFQGITPSLIGVWQPPYILRSVRLCADGNNTPIISAEVIPSVINAGLLLDKPNIDLTKLTLHVHRH